MASQPLPLPLFGASLQDAVSTDRCASLHAMLDARGFVATGGGYPAGYRDNDRLVLDNAALAEEIWQLPALQDALAALGPLEALGSSWLPVAANPRFRACRYEGGQSFTRHRDGAWLASPERRTFLTAQLYLDDGFTGGATRFYSRRDDVRPTVSVTPRRGTILLFDHRLWHDGEAVNGGRKHVLRTDIVFERRDELPAVSSPGRYDIPGAPYVFAVAARHDGTIAVGTREGRVLSLQCADGALRLQRIVEVGPSSVTALVEDAAGRLWAGSRGGIVTLLDAAGTREPWHTDSAITALAACDGAIFVGTAAGTLTRLEAHDRGATATPLGALGGWVWGLSSPMAGDADRRLLIATDAGLFALDSRGACPTRLDPTPIRAVTRTRGGRVITGDAAGLLRGLRDEPVAAHTNAITALVPDGTDGIVSAGEDGMLVWAHASLDDGRSQPLRRQAAHDDFIRALTRSADGRLLSGGYDGAVRRWPLR